MDNHITLNKENVRIQMFEECKYCNSVASGAWKAPRFMPELPPHGAFWHRNKTDDIAIPCHRLNAILVELHSMGLKISQYDRKARLTEAEKWWEAMTRFQNPAELEIWAHSRLADLRVKA